MKKLSLNNVSRYSNQSRESSLKKKVLPGALINRIIRPLQFIEGRGFSMSFQPISQHSVAIPYLIENQSSKRLQNKIKE